MARADMERVAMGLALVLTCLAVFLMGGVIFGLSSLYPTLYSFGVYEGECESRDECPEDRACCPSQRASMVFLSSACLFAADGVMVLYGEVNDRVGPGCCLGVGGSLSVLSFLGIWATATFDLGAACWFASLAGLGLAGPGVFMGCLSFGAAFPAVAPSVSAVAAAMWDSSAVVFLLWALVGEVVPVAHVAFCWAVASAAVGAATWRLLTSRLRSAKDKGLGGEGVLAAPLLDAEAPRWQAGGEEEKAGDVVEEAVAPNRLGAAFRRADLWLVLAFMAAYNLKSALYIETVSDQVRSMGGAFSEAQARRFDLFFDAAFPVGGLAASVAAAALLQRFADRPVAYFLVVAGLANAFALVQLLPTRAAQYGAAALFGPARTVQWSAYFHFVETRAGQG